eukprot:c8631_g1_i1.p1 GENE.c8631_g1_i1~~c8631_g1_i1.p1  ORF type:complete len:199 (+),score=59.71 c8631_g1_i1:981-1577(+)
MELLRLDLSEKLALDGVAGVEAEGLKLIEEFQSEVVVVTDLYEKEAKEMVESQGNGDGIFGKLVLLTRERLERRLAALQSRRDGTNDDQIKEEEDFLITEFEASMSTITKAYEQQQRNLAEIQRRRPSASPTSFLSNLFTPTPQLVDDVDEEAEAVFAMKIARLREDLISQLPAGEEEAIANFQKNLEYLLATDERHK